MMEGSFAQSSSGSQYTGVCSGFHSEVATCACGSTAGESTARPRMAEPISNAAMQGITAVVKHFFEKEAGMSGVLIPWSLAGVCKCRESNSAPLVCFGFDIKGVESKAAPRLTFLDKTAP